MTRETMIDALEAVREQRDLLACMAVNPRRNVDRALRYLNAGDIEMAREYTEDALRDLCGLADLYRAQNESRGRMSSTTSKVLARSWNSNESGLLWERLWMRDEDGYAAKLVCSGVFEPARRFDSERDFWDAFKAEQARAPFWKVGGV